MWDIKITTKKYEKKKGTHYYTPFSAQINSKDIHTWVNVVVPEDSIL